jgi:hypothetical protein
VKTREQWLLQAVKAMAPDFEKAGHPLPEVRVSIGWPGGRGNKQAVIGQCWSASAVKDGKPAIFISPVLSEERPARILDVLRHELVHATGKFGHRGDFKKLAIDVGLTGKMTETVATPELTEKLEKLAARLGPFGHATISSGVRLTGLAGPPVQTTRMLKVQCPEDGYTARLTMKWLAQGAPQCGMCGTIMDWDGK